MRGKITKTAVDGLKPGDTLADTEVKGFVARRLPSGVVTYGLRYRVGGKQRWLALGLHGRITPDKARQLAKKRTGEVADARDPAGEREAERAKAEEDSANTVDALLDSFVKRYIRAKDLRSGDGIERLFARCVRPTSATGASTSCAGATSCRCWMLWRTSGEPGSRTRCWLTLAPHLLGRQPAMMTSLRPSRKACGAQNR